MLYRGHQLDLEIYSRAELKGSDHRPGEWCCITHFGQRLNVETIVFAIFRAEVRIIDAAKQAALSKLLLETVTATGPGEKLDETLANLMFSTDLLERE